MSVALESRASEGLEALGLSVALEHLDAAAQRAAAEGWSYTHFLGYLLDGELSWRKCPVATCLAVGVLLGLWQVTPLSRSVLSRISPATSRMYDRLLPALEDAIRNRDQTRATALAARYIDSGLPNRALWDILLREAISEDGALHAEKFYRTATEEFGSTRAAFRWRQLIALARVTASEHGYPALGHAEACRLLGV